MKKHNTVWGCDLCQTVCPYNKAPRVTPIAFFKEALIPHLTLDILESMNDGAFSERAFAWRGRKTVERNLRLFEE